MRWHLAPFIVCRDGDRWGSRMLKRLFGRQDEARVEAGLAKTRVGLVARLATVFGPTDITDATWDDLEAQLIL